MKITSDMATDPTVAGQQVPLLTRDAEGNEVDWRKIYKCDCPPTEDINALPTCPGCITLRGILDRLRADRRTRATREASSTSRPAARKSRRLDEDIA